LALGVGLLMTGAMGWSRSPAREHALYVSAPFVGLLEGLFDGEVTFAELKQRGDVGLGAVDALDGELVLLDGTPYQVKSDGSVRPLLDSQRTPFAMVTLLQPDQTFEIGEDIDFPELRKRLDEKLASASQPYAFRIEGAFSYVKTRSVPRQTPPYRRLIEIIKDQVQFELRDVSGVIVGFRVPDYLTGLSVPGYHFHFLTADRKAGGHLLAFRGSRLHVVTDRCTGISASLPRSPAFSHVGLTPGIQAEIDQILGRAPIKP
jgi:acetolactate decarboxylase